MQTSRPTRPVIAIRPRPAAPQPRWDRVFLEPQYADGLPYEDAVDDDQDAADEGGPDF